MGCKLAKDQVIYLCACVEVGRISWYICAFSRNAQMYTKFSQLPHMRTSISPDPWLVYIPLNRSTCIRTFKKSAGRVRGAKGRKIHNALFHLFLKMPSKLRRCTTKFSQLPHMRTSISPDPWLVYIPLNRSTCIRTFNKVCRSCERRKRKKKA